MSIITVEYLRFGQVNRIQEQFQDTDVRRTIGDQELALFQSTDRDEIFAVQNTCQRHPAHYSYYFGNELDKLFRAYCENDPMKAHKIVGTQHQEALIVFPEHLNSVRVIVFRAVIPEESI